MINDLCELLKEFDNSLKTESCSSLYLEGIISDSTEVLDKFADAATNFDAALHEHITVLIDGYSVNVNALQEHLLSDPHAGNFEITIDTKALIQAFFSGSGDVDEYLFTSKDAFLENLDEIGITTPLCESDINKATNTRIHIFELEKPFGGPKLAVIPTLATTGDSEYSNDCNWLKGSELPSSEILLKQVHLISTERVNLDPSNFELSWGDLSQETADPFKRAYAQQLLVSLSSNYYDLDKVQYKGVKHIDAKISPEPNTQISKAWLDTVSESVKWIYSVVDPSVPLQLFVDRLSLEYKKGSSLLNIESSSFSNCLEQARNNYKFVIAKRSDDYRKELKEIYSDIKTVTDKYMAKSAALTSEFLKSLMAVGFMLTVGTVSKAIVNAGLLHSKEGLLLFKIIGFYLICSFFIRWLNASADLKISLKALNSWSKKLHSHISSDEVNSLIKKQVGASRIYYLCSLALVTVVQFTLALAAIYAEGILWYLNL